MMRWLPFLAQADEPVRLWPGIHAIEARPECAKELVLAQSRRESAFARFEFYSGDGMHQAQGSARDMMRIGVLIGAEPHAEV